MEQNIQDKIEALRVENKMLREALHKISTRRVDNPATYAWETLNPQGQK